MIGSLLIAAAIAQALPPVFDSTQQEPRPGLAPYDSVRSPLNAPWQPGMIEGEDASIWVKGNRFLGQLQHLRIQWNGVWDDAESVHLKDTSQETFTTAYDIIQYDPVQRGERSLFVAGVELSTGNSVIERWAFDDPVVDYVTNTYVPGPRRLVQSLYNANVIGQIGIRGLSHSIGSTKKAAVCQFEDSGDVYLYPYADPPSPIAAPELLFSDTDPNAQFLYATSARLELAGVETGHTIGNFLVMKPKPEPTGPTDIIRLLIFDTDKDGNFDSMQTYTSGEWDLFDW